MHKRIDGRRKYTPTLGAHWPGLVFEYKRTSGEMVCEACKERYRDHPQWVASWLRVLCDGRLVKL